MMSRRSAVRRSVVARRRVKAAWLLLGFVLTGCGDAAADRQTAATEASATSTPSPSPNAPDAAVPEEFESACGKPGSRVVTERLEVHIKRSDCDLTGVTIVNQGRGAMVPEPGFGVGSSGGVTVQVDKVTGDMTFRAEDTVPNA
jgi:hypothetical protein